MGCLAGPVVVCAVSCTAAFYSRAHTQLRAVRDSKLLSAKQRETYATVLRATPGLQYALAFCYPKTIDRINIYQAARQAMRRAVSKLKNNSPLIVLVDGPTKIPKLPHPQMAIVKGDCRVFTIACASIIAKVYRDRMMLNYAKHYPAYGFEAHKGYGTALHLSRLAKYGTSPLHRQSFAPVAALRAISRDKT